MGSRTPPAGTETPDAVPQRKSLVREYAETILVCVVFVIFSRAFVVQQSEIPSGSMEDTILEGDYILVNRFQYAPVSFEWERALLPIRDVRRGDVVVFKQPDQPEVDFIKRVVGLPGEVVQMRNGYMTVDGRLIDEPYVGPLYREDMNTPAIRVPEGHFFLMGDHRNRSQDSRVFGPVPAEVLKGRAFLVLFSTRAKAPPGETPGQVTVGSLWRKIYNLVFHNRTDRAFSPIR